MCGCMNKTPQVNKDMPVEAAPCLFTLEELQAMIPKAEELGSIQLSVLNNQINIYDSNCGVLAQWIKINIADV